MHYLKTVDSSFVIDVLNNEMSSFGFKKTLLKQILEEKVYENDFQNLEKLNRIRNLFGHASLSLKSDTNINDEKAEIYFIDPKKSGNEINPKTKAEEFENLLSKVMHWLIKVGKERGINYPD